MESQLSNSDPNLPAKSNRSPMKSLLVGVMTLFLVIYLVNPTAGVVELIPDVVPFIGNLDEATATALLLGCLSYFGIELPFLRRNSGQA